MHDHSDSKKVPKKLDFSCKKGLTKGVKFDKIDKLLRGAPNLENDTEKEEERAFLAERRRALATRTVRF